MKAVCYVLRNRVKAGWGHSSWLSVLAHAGAVAGNEELDAATADDVIRDNTSDRLLQLLLRDIDDIYLGQDLFVDTVRGIVCGDEPGRAALYYNFVDRPARLWFIENIIRRPQEHPQVGNVGPMMLFR